MTSFIFSYDEAVRTILLIVIKNSNNVLYSFLSKQFTKYASNETEKKRLQNQLNYIVNKLINEGILTEIRISERERILSIADHKKALDSIAKTPARNPHRTAPSTKQTETKTITEQTAEIIAMLPKWSRMHEEHEKTARKYFIKTPARLSPKDLREIQTAFERYIADVSDKVLIFKTPEDEYTALPYKVRYTDPATAVAKILQFEETYQNAVSQFDTAIFITITVPPIFPLRLSMWYLSFVFHRLKALIRKQEHETKPHIKVIEPQKRFNPHTHALIFDVEYIMPKQQFTLWLDKQLVEFLSNLGEHYKKTINKRATEDTVKALNRFGKKMLKKYERYKKKLQKKARAENKQKAFTGPINHLTKVTRKGNDFEFEEKPKDAETDKVFEYIKYYVIKNASEAKKNAEDPLRKQNLQIAFYWLLRIPFFYASPKLRPQPPPKRPAGWEFITTCKIDEAISLLSN